MLGIAQHLADVHAKIAAACQRAGRRAEDVTLLAVSKLQPTELIRTAYAAGQRDFGENYAQELRDKATQLADLTELRWHAIGTLQRNKVKYIAKSASVFHALCSLEIAEELSAKRQGPPIAVFVEVNVADEDTKSGLLPAELPKLCDKLAKLSGIRLVGLMTMPPQPEPPIPWKPEDNRRHFARLRELAHGLGLRELSMGTTADYEVAIEEGSTIVRVGRSIFGARPHP